MKEHWTTLGSVSLRGLLGPAALGLASLRATLGFAGFALLLGLGGGCGDTERSLAVSFSLASKAELSPLATEVGLSKVRLFVEGDVDYDDVIVDLSPAELAAPVELGGLVSETVQVRVEGYDDAGAVVAFGRISVPVTLEDVDAVSIPFRRNLAYVTHMSTEGQDNPSGVIYALDLNTRALVDRIRLPGAAPRARSITARGGIEMLVSMLDGNETLVGRISLDDHSVTTFPLPGLQDLILGVESSASGVALGGGRVTFIDFDSETTSDLGVSIGGTVNDAAISFDGSRALMAVDIYPPGLLLVNIDTRTLETHDLLTDPSGIALDAAGELAYVTSSSSRRILSFDLVRRRSAPSSGSFSSSVDLAVYSDSLRAVIGLDRSGTLGQLQYFHVPSQSAGGAEQSATTLEQPTGMATDGTGRRIIVVAAGSSTVTAGLTVVDAFSDRLEGSSQLYPGDPEDTFVILPATPDRAAVLGRQRYRPSSVAVVYGR